MKEWTKELVVDNREFHLTFWRDSWGLLWTNISEKVSRKPTFFNRKNYEMVQIREYWTSDNPVEVATQEIVKRLTHEKEKKEFEKLLDKFCS